MSSFNLQPNSTDISSFDTWANSIPEPNEDFDAFINRFILAFVAFIVFAVICAINELSKAINAKATKSYVAINKSARPDSVTVSVNVAITPDFPVISDAHFISVGQDILPPPNPFQCSEATNLQFPTNGSGGDSDVSYRIPVRRTFEIECSYQVTGSNDDSTSLLPQTGR